MLYHKFNQYELILTFFIQYKKKIIVIDSKIIKSNFCLGQKKKVDFNFNFYINQKYQNQLNVFVVLQKQLDREKIEMEHKKLNKNRGKETRLELSEEIGGGERDENYEKSIEIEQVSYGYQVNQQKAIKNQLKSGLNAVEVYKNQILVHAKLKPKPIFSSRKCNIIVGIIIFILMLGFMDQIGLFDQIYIMIDPNTCTNKLPYKIDSPSSISSEYYYWYGKVGRNGSNSSYQTGHFIERHIAQYQKCTYNQSRQSKTVFQSWDQTLKALNLIKYKLNCSSYISTQFEYNFTFKIQNSNDYIKGIDCRTGQKYNFSKLFILYKNAVKDTSISYDQYLNSKYLTIWTFYPQR